MITSVAVVLVAIVVVLHVQMSRVQRLETDRDPGAHVGVNSIFASIVLVSTWDTSIFIGYAIATMPPRLTQTEVKEKDNILFVE